MSKEEEARMPIRRGLSGRLRREVRARDGEACVKCHSRSDLEIHHMIPVVFGGLDVVGNLVTLCKTCHREAPNDPADFFRWAATRLPPSLDMARQMSRLVVSIVAHRWKKSKEEIEEAMRTVDEVYPDIWKMMRAVADSFHHADEEDPFAEAGRFYKKHYPDSAAKFDGADDAKGGSS